MSTNDGGTVGGGPASRTTPTPRPRPGRSDDALALTALFLAARAGAMPNLPVMHTPEETLWWMTHRVLAGTEGTVTVAEDVGGPVGFIAASVSHVAHLYVAPEAQGIGTGSALLDHAKAASKGSLELMVFQCNDRARRFYEHRGFTLVSLGDGRNNEERTPDALYRWERDRDVATPPT